MVALMRFAALARMAHKTTVPDGVLERQKINFMKSLSVERMGTFQGGRPNTCAVVTNVGSIAFGLVGLAPLSIAISLVGLYGCEYSAI